MCRLLRQSVWVLGGLIFYAALAEETATGPDWWYDRGVIKAGSSAVDYAPANQGQLKNFARAARDEMIETNVIQSGHAIDLMVKAWISDNSKAQDYSPVNIGQLKAVAKPFYDRFIEVGLRGTGSYPWAQLARPARDYAPANLGQLKAVFNFGITLDANENGIPDAWELQMFGDLNHNKTDDSDHDGMTNFEEWQAGTNPGKWDTDGDGISDSQEIAEGTDPNNAASNSTILLGLRVFTPLRPL